MNLILPLLLLSLFTAPVLFGRSWTNSDGKSIQAEYVSSDGTTVQLMIGGKPVDYPLVKLSLADREFVTAQTRPSKSAISTQTGEITDVKIGPRLFPAPEDYYKDRVRKDCIEAMETGQFWPDSNPEPSEKWIAHDAEKDTCRFYVPASYDGSTAYGLFLWINASDPGGIPQHWFPVFDEMKLIAVSADHIGNDHPLLRRAHRSIDALTTARARYKIDPKRRIVSGISGGGHMAMLTAALYPEQFLGAISHAAQSYLPGAAGSGHFPGLELSDFKRGARGNLKWLVVSGDKDYNYAVIKETSKHWESVKLRYRFLEVPGMEHTPCDAASLKQAIAWIEQP